MMLFFSCVLLIGAFIIMATPPKHTETKLDAKEAGIFCGLLLLGSIWTFLSWLF